MVAQSNEASGTAKPTSSTPNWGLLPVDVLQSLKTKCWHNPKKLKRLLSGEQPFPVVVALKPPRGNAAIQNMGHFQSFVSQWRDFSHHHDAAQNACSVNWEQRAFRSLEEQDVPTKLSVPDISSLASLLGANEERQLQSWLSTVRYIFESLAAHSDSHQALFLALVDHLDTLNNFEQSDLELLVRLIPQLHKGMGQGGYLRALPVAFVDTKFIESHLVIVESIVAALLDNSAKELGLMHWLHCVEKPKDWLLIKPLCTETRALLGGLPLLRLSSDTLQEYELPAINILVIENEQPCLALNDVRDTIAVSGGGKNVSWLKAHWLIDKNVGYWGDIDSEGFAILSDARSKLSSIVPLMMDEPTVATFAQRMVSEPDSVFKDPIALTDHERDLFRSLRAGHYAGKRLEQERLPMEYVRQSIDAWIC